MSKKRPNQGSESSGEGGGAGDGVERRVIQLRHDLRNPLAHILGFSELLLEAARIRHYGEAEADLIWLIEKSEEVIVRISEVLDPAKVRVEPGPVEALRGEVRVFCCGVVEVVERLQGQEQGRGDEHFTADVERIESSARRMLGMAEGISTVGLRSGREEDGEAASAREEELSEASTRAGLVLVVDDDAEVRETLVRLVEGGGRVASGAESGTKAMDVLVTEKVEFVLLDLDMPGLNGEGTLRALKGSMGTRHIPVLILAGEGQIERAKACVANGAAGYLVKPLEAGLDWEKIEAALGR